MLLTYSLLLIFSYSVLFYLLGRIIQTKLKLWIDNNLFSIIFGFFTYSLITQIVFVFSIMFGFNISLITIFNGTKDLVLVMFVFYYWKVWFGDYKYSFTNKKVFFTNICVLLLFVALLGSLYAFTQTVDPLIGANQSNQILVNLQDIVDGNSIYLRPFALGDKENIWNRLIVFNSFYYWIATQVNLFNLDLATHLEFSFLVYAVGFQFLTLYQFFKILTTQTYFPIFLAFLSTLGIFFLLNIDLSNSTMFTPLIITSIFLVMVTYFSFHVIKIEFLIYFGIILMTMFFLCSSLFFVCILITISLLISLITTKRGIKQIFWFYFSILLSQFSFLFYFTDLGWSIPLLIISLVLFAWWLLFFINATTKKQMDFNIAIGIISILCIIFIIISIIFIVINPNKYITLIKQYFLLEQALWVVILNFIILASIFIYGGYVFLKKQKSMFERSFLMVVYYFLFVYNPFTIQLTSIIIPDDSFWVLSIVSWTIFPILLILLINSFFPKISTKFSKKTIINDTKNLKERLVVNEVEITSEITAEIQYPNSKDN